jgi:predicted DsbA family dithiol-disulfide isomerase
VKQLVHIEVFSDVVCPWCYLGKHRLEKAMDDLKGEYDFQVQWSPYQLTPDMPPEGRDRREYLAEKFGSYDALDGAHARLKALGEDAGIRYNFDAASKAVNTFNAHRLLWLAGQEGKQEAMEEILFKAYFTDGLDLGDKQVLVGLAEKGGMDPAKARRMLDGKEGSAEVSEALSRARSLGVRGVPFFVFEGKLAVSGAQSPEVLADAIKESLTAKRP